ncbi:MAG: hypothetical protein M1826_002839 [Phylliscum demangeonii]|nr:MAG: hypothetical protein M1826_002839 [Phylliscum demangeonii]
MANDQISLIWDDAVRQYDETTGINPHDACFPKPQSAEDLLNLLDQKQSKFSEFRSKKAKLFKVLSGTLKPIQLLGNVASGGASTVFPPSSAIFGAVTYLIDAASGVSAAYDAIISLFASMNESTCRLLVHLQQEIVPELRQIVTEIFAEFMSLCATSTKYIKRGRFLKYWKILFMGRDSAIQGALNRLKTLTDNEVKMVGALTLSQASKTGKVVDNMHSNVVHTNVMAKETNASLKNISVSLRNMDGALSSLRLVGEEEGHEGEKQTETAMLQKLKRDLCPDRSVQDDLDAATNGRVAGTCEWIRAEPLFQAWLERSQALLWVSGGPGAGKSYLSASIIQHLQGLFPQGVNNTSRVSIAYFFCRDFHPNRRSFDKILRTLAYQIAENDSVYLRHALRVCEALDDLRTLRSIWRTLFLDFFNVEGLKSSVYIIVDGLDESYRKDRNEFLQLLREVERKQVGDRIPAIKTLLVGRLDLTQDIEGILERAVPMIEISARKNSMDIDSYIASGIKKSATVRKVPEPLRQEIIYKLREGADGMFLWVNLMITEISNKRRLDSIRQALEQMPEGLSAMILHILQRLSTELEPEAREELTTLLSWVTCAAMPLSLGVLDFAVTLRSSPEDKFVNLEDDLRKRYASLFTLVREDGKTTEDLQPGAQRHDVDFEDDSSNEHLNPMESGPTNAQAGAEENEEDDEVTSNPCSTLVRLRHASLGDYLRGNQDQQGIAVVFNLNQSELVIAKTCMAVLCDQGGFEEWVLYSFLIYAASFWQHHLIRVDLSKVETEDKREVVRFLLMLFREPETFDRWTVVRSFSLPGEKLPGARDLHEAWLFDNEATNCIQKWLSDEAVSDILDPEIRAWSLTTGTRFVEELFKPIAMQLARLWLQCGATGWGCYTFIDAYLRKIERQPDETQLPSDSTSVEVVDANRILTVAHWAQFERTALWLAKVGVVLRESGNIDLAIKYGLSAIEEDDKLAIAYADLARTYEWCREYETAIQYALTSQELQKAEDNPDDDTYEIAIRYLYLGQVPAAVAYLGRKTRLRTLDVSCSKLHLRLLLELKEFKEVFTLLRQLEAAKKPDTGFMPYKGYSYLMECFCDEENGHTGHYVHRPLRRQAQRLQETEYLNHCYEVVIQEAKKEGHVRHWAMTQAWHAQFLSELNIDIDRAVWIWEHIVSYQALVKHEERLAQARRLASHELSMVAFSKALAAYRAGTAYASFVTSMERLAKNRAIAQSRAVDPNGSENCALVLASFYRIQGRLDDAKTLIRPMVISALDILTDDDRKNDKDRFLQLSRLLNRMGDDLNTTAARHLRYMTYAAEHGQQQRDAADNAGAKTDDELKDNGEEEGAGQAQSDAEKKPDEAELEIDKRHLSDGAGREQDQNQDHQPAQGSAPVNNDQPCASVPAVRDDPGTAEESEYAKSGWEQTVPLGIFGTCDGPCGSGLGPNSGTHRCRYCVDYDFCDACFHLLQTGQMLYRICDPTHDFFTCTFPLSPIPPGMVRVGDQLRPISEWLDDLRTAWTLV